MDLSLDSKAKPARPIVYDYGSEVEFLSDLLKFYKSQGHFSLRQRALKVGGCSQGLISQILNGKRQLNRENFPVVAEVFKLTKLESQFIDSKLFARVRKLSASELAALAPKQRKPQNHLLSDWLHPYVKDLVNLKGFQAEPEILYSMLKGIAPIGRVQKSIQFLLREGFWRTSTDRRVVPEDSAVVTTQEIPNEKIRAFHKRALEIAARGLSAFPPTRRKASTVLISVDEEHLDELRGMVDSFQHQLLEFIEKHPNGRDSLVQVTIHLTPVGDRHE